MSERPHRRAKKADAELPEPCRLPMRACGAQALGGCSRGVRERPTSGLTGAISGATARVKPNGIVSCGPRDRSATQAIAPALAGAPFFDATESAASSLRAAPEIRVSSLVLAATCSARLPWRQMAPATAGPFAMTSVKTSNKVRKRRVEIGRYPLHSTRRPSCCRDALYHEIQYINAPYRPGASLRRCCDNPGQFFRPPTQGRDRRGAEAGPLERRAIGGYIP